MTKFYYTDADLDSFWGLGAIFCLPFALRLEAQIYQNDKKLIVPFMIVHSPLTGTPSHLVQPLVWKSLNPPK